MKEIWKPVAGFESLYEVSNRGRVRSLSRVIRVGNGATARTRARVLKPWKMGNYLGVSLSHRSVLTKAYIHRLVASAFCERSKQSFDEVNHINNDPHDNQAENLEWVDKQGNESHKVACGRSLKGESNASSKLTLDDVIDIKLFCIQRAPQSAIAAMFGIAQSSVCRVNRGVSWSHIALTEAILSTAQEPPADQET